jgi:monofunctional biosynthetic peptidoglycan transglycosylase
MLQGRWHLLLGLGLLAGLLLAIFASVLSHLPGVSQLREAYPEFVKRDVGQVPEIRVVAQPPKGWVRLDHVARVAWGAVLVSEDWAFFDHPGFDILQIRKTIVESAEEGHLTRGASTITQQVAKNLYLSHEKSLLRKFHELAISLKLERELGKRKILEIYLNIAEWGPGIFGIRQAARHYFSKSPSELTPREGAFLAMLLPSPKRYSQSFRAKQLSPFARRSIDAILLKMQQARFIDEDQRLMAQTSTLSFEQSSVAPLWEDDEGFEGGDGLMGVRPSPGSPPPYVPPPEELSAAPEAEAAAKDPENVPEIEEAGAQSAEEAPLGP